MDFEKSKRSSGNKYIQANGSDASITNNSAGRIRLIRLSKNFLNEKEPVIINSFRIIDVIR